jgi:hypothetical protein
MAKAPSLVALGAKLKRAQHGDSEIREYIEGIETALRDMHVEIVVEVGLGDGYRLRFTQHESADWRLLVVPPDNMGAPMLLENAGRRWRAAIFGAPLHNLVTKIDDAVEDEIHNLPRAIEKARVLYEELLRGED